MPGQLATLYVTKADQWRAWLRENHAASPGVWLVYHKAHTGVDSLPYDDSVREALCYGWIDSTVRRLDERRYARKFTPRRPGSVWSASNRRRWAELRAEGRLAAPGLETAPDAAARKPQVEIPELPAYFARALETRPAARECFQSLTKAQRRNFVTWVHIAKRPETRARRIRESIELLAQGRKLGLK